MSTTDTASKRWRKIIRDQEASGLSVAAYCRRSGVAAWSLYCWRRRFAAQRRRGEKFLEVKLAREDAGVAGGRAGSAARTLRPSVEPSVAASAPGRTVGGLELHLPGRRWVVVPPGFDRPTLVELLRVLETKPVSPGSEGAGP